MYPACFEKFVVSWLGLLGTTACPADLLLLLQIHSPQHHRSSLRKRCRFWSRFFLHFASGWFAFMCHLTSAAHLECSSAAGLQPAQVLPHTAPCILRWWLKSKKALVVYFVQNTPWPIKKCKKLYLLFLNVALDAV